MKSLPRILFSAIVVAATQATSAQIELSDSRAGMNCRSYLGSVSLHWHQPGGDWIDADAIPYGDQPFSQQQVSKQARTQPVEWDITALARQWESDSGTPGGVYLRQLANDRYWVRFHSREAVDSNLRPRALIRWDDGSEEILYPEADATMTCSSFSGNGHKNTLNVGAGRSTIIIFPFTNRPNSSINSAQLTLSIDKQYQVASDIGVFQLNAPIAEEHEPAPGLSRDFPKDQGIEMHPSVVFATDFEDSNWQDAWSSLSDSSVTNLVIEDDANRFLPLNENALEVTVKKGKKQGLNLLYRFAEKTGVEPESMYFRYYLRLGNDWAPRVGGKMPGFAGTYNTAGWGGRSSDGTNGWSSRGAYANSSLLPEESTMLGSYVYHTGWDTGYGETVGWNLGPTGLVEKNRWYSVEQYLQLNTPGESNGVMKSWVDGVLVFNREDYRFRDTDELKIETLWMNVYHGGTRSSSQDIRLYIDNVVIATEYIGPGRNP
ncbi:MAG: polysaccharide lyase [Chromatocurvus sp.]